MKSNIDCLQSLIAEMREDDDERVGNLGVLLRALVTRPRRRLILWVRIQEWLDRNGRHGLARIISARIYNHYGCVISPTARIGRGVLFAHPVGVVIGDGTIIGKDCIIYQNVTLGKRSLGVGGYPVVGDRVVIFAGAQVVGDIELADDVTVGALSLVTDSCQVPGSRLVGIPARSMPQRSA